MGVGKRIWCGILYWQERHIRDRPVQDRETLGTSISAQWLWNEPVQWAPEEVWGGEAGCSTWSIGANVQDFTLGPTDVVVLHHGEGHSLDVNSVLCPGLQPMQQNARLDILVGREVHVHHVPAVGAAGILPIILRNVFKGSERQTGKLRGCFRAVTPKLSDAFSRSLAYHAFYTRDSKWNKWSIRFLYKNKIKTGRTTELNTLPRKSKCYSYWTDNTAP